MKILHTSDWHLGQKFLFNDREAEHQLALEWLAQTIIDQNVDVLLVAGDIFDIGNPPNYARRLYYRFLTSLLNTSCRHIVITGGNHDSPSMLNAPRELLQALNVHVVGAVTNQIEDQIIELKDENGNLEAIIAAVPFLRDRDLKYSFIGESGYDRIEAMRAGIRNHYEQLATLLKPYGKKKVPIITTGHLYASGAEAAEKQNNIYIGDVENIKAEEFPPIFDYIALGHLHRPQIVGNLEHIRYSGSLIPLSFSETKDDKSVFLLHFKNKSLDKIDTISVPTFRRLKSIQGDIKKVEKSLERFSQKKDRILTPWLEIIVETEQVIPQLDLYLKELTKESDLEILKIRLLRLNQGVANQEDLEDLHTLEVMDVFRKKCTSFGNPPEELEELEKTFIELNSWLEEREE